MRVAIECEGGYRIWVRVAIECEVEGGYRMRVRVAIECEGGYRM